MNMNVDVIWLENDHTRVKTFEQESEAVEFVKELRERLGAKVPVTLASNVSLAS